MKLISGNYVKVLLVKRFVFFGIFKLCFWNPKVTQFTYRLFFTTTVNHFPIYKKCIYKMKWNQLDICVDAFNISDIDYSGFKQLHNTIFFILCLMHFRFQIVFVRSISFVPIFFSSFFRLSVIILAPCIYFKF